MLLLDARCAVIDGISVFPDHADPLQWYYLPTAPHLTVVDGIPSFQLIGFRGDEGGGLLSFDCNIGLTDAQLTGLKQKIRGQFDLDDDPHIGPVPLEGGTVRLIVMGTDSGAVPVEGEPAPEQPFVVTAVHNATPSLYDVNQASFSVLLDKAGYALVRGTLDAVIMPVAVVYSLDYLGLRPAYRVSLTIDWDRVQKHLDETFGTKLWIFSADISKAVDELDESKAIDLRADTFVPEDTEGVIDRRDAALAQVKAMITTAFFEASLPPWTPEQPEDWEKALKMVGDFVVGQQAGAAGGSPFGGQVSFSYKRTDYTRIDKKHLNVNFSERTTVRRSIHPQGHLESLFSVIAQSPELLDRLVREVTVDSDFFAKRRIEVRYRPNLGAPFIDSIDARAEYGGVARNKLLTPGDWSAEFEWLSDVRDGVMVRDVDVSYEVNLANADSSERPASLAREARPVTEDIEAISPEKDLFTIRSVPVLAERIPWTRFDSVEVHLRHRDEPHGIDEQELFRLTSEKPDALWPMFVMGDQTSYEVRSVLRAVDGNDVDSGWAPSDEVQVTVRNPFRPRTLAVLAEVSWDEVRDVFVDVRYADPGNDVLVEESLHLSSTSDPPTFVVDLRDPTRTAIEFTVTFSYLDGRVKRLPPSVTYDNRIVVNPTMLGHRVVEVRPPADWAADHVEKVTVEMRFEDFVANLSYASTFVLDGPDARARFEYDYVDTTRNRYEWRSTVLFTNGLKHVKDWTASSEPVVVPPLP